MTNKCWFLKKITLFWLLRFSILLSSQEEYIHMLPFITWWSTLSSKHLSAWSYLSFLTVSEFSCFKHHTLYNLNLEKQYRHPIVIHSKWTFNELYLSVRCSQWIDVKSESVFKCILLSFFTFKGLYIVLQFHIRGLVKMFYTSSLLYFWCHIQKSGSSINM